MVVRATTSRPSGSVLGGHWQWNRVAAQDRRRQHPPHRQPKRPHRTSAGTATHNCVHTQRRHDLTSNPTATPHSTRSQCPHRPPTSPVRCEGTTRAGTSCQLPAMGGHIHCSGHLDPPCRRVDTDRKERCAAQQCASEASGRELTAEVESLPIHTRNGYPMLHVISDSPFWHLVPVVQAYLAHDLDYTTRHTVGFVDKPDMGRSVDGVGSFQ